MISLGILFTFALQFYIPVVIMWPQVTDKFGPFKYPVFTELAFRACLVFVTCKLLLLIRWYGWKKINKYNTIFCLVTLAEVIPYLNHFISLVGAVSSTALALLFPPILEFAVKWSVSEVNTWMVVKNSLILVLGVIGCITGTYASIVEIVKAFQGEED